MLILRLWAFLSPSPVGESAIGMRDLGTVGGSFSYGMAISANNHVVGYSTINKIDSRVHVFWFDGHGMKDLGSLAPNSVNPLEDQSIALGVNSSDRIVGHTYLQTISANTSRDPAGGQVPLGRSRSRRDDRPQKLIETAADTYRLNSAVAINDNGQIVAIGLSKATGTRRAVLLTPPSPVPPR